ncbi:hypothetical protein F5X96DRAFT_617323 [Biscogniauxia mediterranea]|nr:hypothetical protein F5X96DRAFT_617323 [Biscogniauxia mediterranea]
MPVRVNCSFPPFSIFLLFLLIYLCLGSSLPTGMLASPRPETASKLDSSTIGTHHVSTSASASASAEKPEVCT